MWLISSMETTAIPARQAESVTQFSIFTPNRLGRLYELVGLLASHGVHVLAMTVLDTSDSAIIRVVVDDPQKGRRLLADRNFPFTESALLVVEVPSATKLNELMAALLEAEININYLYSFIPHPEGHSLIGLSMEDNEMAEKVLTRHQFRVLKQPDISR
jgi:hypothetical protein